MSPQISHIDRLPSEILHIICLYLSEANRSEVEDYSDLANLRLTSRKWDQLGARAMMHTLHVRFSHHSLQNLLKVAQHPVLSTFVQHVHYDSAPLQQHTESSFERELRTISDVKLYGRKPYYSGAPIRNHRYEGDLRVVIKESWSKYQDMLLEQAYMRKHHIVQSVLARVLHLLTNLQKVTVQTQNWKFSTSHAFIRASECLPATNLEYFADADMDGSYSEVALSDIAMSCAHHPRLSAFAMSAVQWRSFLPAPASLNIYTPMFASLKVLKLIFEPWLTMDTPAESAVQMQQEFGNVLAAAKELESVDFKVRYGYKTLYDFGLEYDLFMTVKLETIFAPCTFENLKILALTQITSSTLGMADFLKKHVSSLRNLTVDTLQILDEKVADILTMYLCFRDSLKLDSIRLGGIWILRDSGSLEAFVANMEEIGARRLESWIIEKSEMPLSEAVTMFKSANLDLDLWQESLQDHPHEVEV